jgi:uncharacterized membrane protein
MPNFNLIKNIRAFKNSNSLKNISDDVNIGPIVVIGLTMIIIYFFFDSSFPILPIISTIFGIYLLNNNLPVGKILVIVLCVYLLYHALRAIMFVISGRCGQHRPALMLERFAANNYNSLRRRLTSLDAKIVDSATKVDTMRSLIESLKPDICAVLKQIDESNEGEYNSNIPEEEFTLSAEEQKERAKKRAEKARLAVTKSKTTYSKNHGNIPLLECFNDTDEIDAINVDIASTEENLRSLNSDFSELKSLLGGDKSNSYNSTLNYNDRYIKKMQNAIISSIEKNEGFIDLGVDKATLDSNPNLYVQTLEENYVKLSKDIIAYEPIIDGYKKRIKQQKTDVATAKGPVNDDKVQKNTLDASYNAQKTKA